MTTPAQGAPASGSKTQQAAPPPTGPFRRGTIRTLVQDGYQVSSTVGTSTNILTQYSPTPNAFLRGLWIQTACTVASNTANTSFAGDGPWNIYSQVVFSDANQKPIVGPLNGYQLMVANKFGGYQNNGDPRASAVYTTTTGTVATGGSFEHVLYVPLEVTSRDALGALQNKSASSAFQLQLTINTLANLYTTAPAGSGSSVNVTVNVQEDGYLQPKAADATGNPLAQAPPQLGTTQYWTAGNYNALNGSQQVQLTQGLGYPIRNLIAINYDVSAVTRATGDTDWPTSTSFIYRGTTFFNSLKNIWKDQMSRLYAYNATAADSAWGLENGVYVLPFDNDFDNGPGAELRNAYLVTQQGDQFQLVGTFNGNSNLVWLANYVAPIAGPQNAASIQAG